jgi:hypothetical protein
VLIQDSDIIKYDNEEKTKGKIIFKQESPIGHAALYEGGLIGEDFDGFGILYGCVPRFEEYNHVNGNRHGITKIFNYYGDSLSNVWYCYIKGSH